ncbi:MAG: glycosyltransferase family 2 protein, partial [Bacteroidota bacterium]
MIKKLSIVIPAYNEAATIHLILDKIKDVQLDNEIEKEILIINDCSKDDTKGAIQNYISNNNELNIQYFEHSINKGKGAALHTGIKNASGEYLVIQDA